MQDINIATIQESVKEISEILQLAFQSLLINKGAIFRFLSLIANSVGILYFFLFVNALTMFIQGLCTEEACKKNTRLAVLWMSLAALILSIGSFLIAAWTGYGIFSNITKNISSLKSALASPVSSLSGTLGSIGGPIGEMGAKLSGTLLAI